MKDVVIFDRVEKQLRRLPKYVVNKLNGWAKSVARDGLREVRKVRGYHDEPLQGDRFGQRSVRLTKGYRAIYREFPNGTINLILIEEVNKHAY